MTQTLNEQVRAVVTGPVATAGVDLEGVEVAIAGKHRLVRVLVDTDGGVSLDEVAALTSEISKALDAADVMGDRPYTLEVGSPGVDRPLTEPRHWRRNAGRLVRVKQADGSTITGRIATSDEGSVELRIPAAGKAPESTVVLPLATVARAVVQVELSRPEGA